MLTVSDRVRAWLRDHPTHTRFLADGLINASALARYIQPSLEKQLGETVSKEAVTLAINRYSKTAKQYSSNHYEQYIGEVSVQSGLSLIAIPQTTMRPDVFAKAIAVLHKTNEYSLYTSGVCNTMLIGKQSIIMQLAPYFPSLVITHDLAAVTVMLKPGHLPTPGVCAYILQRVALQNINLQEVASSHDELSLVIDKHDTNKVLECLS